MSAARWACALAALAVGLVLAMMTAAGFAYVAPQGAERLRELAAPLAVSVVVGLATVAVIRAALRRGVVSPWLLAGVVPAALFALHHLGVISG